MPTVRTSSYLINTSFPTNGPPGGVTPINYQDFVVSVPGLAATSLNAGVAAGRYYAGSSPTATASLPIQAGIAQVSYLDVQTVTTFTKAGIETLPDLAPTNRAQDFVRSVGINTHVSQGTTGYTNSTNLLADLATLGITLIRDNDTATGGFNTIYGALGAGGIRISFATFSQPATYVTNVKAAVTAGMPVGNIVAMEGPNEPNQFTYTYNTLASNVTWQGVAMAQEQIYKLVKRDPVLCNIPVATPTAIGETIDNVGLQFTQVPVGSSAVGRLNTWNMGVVPTMTYDSPNAYRTLTQNGVIFADMLNSHSYPTGTNGYWDTGFGDQLWGIFYFDFAKVATSHFWGTDIPTILSTPRLISETGFRTDSASGSGNYVDQATQAKNLLSGSLMSFLQGNSYYIIYDLYDTVGTDAYGIYSAAATPKTAGTYIANMLSIMKDAGADATTFNAGSPGIIGVTGQPATSWWGTFQKTDGSYWLMMTSQVSNWNWSTNLPVTVTGSTVTLTFPSTMPTVNYFDPTVGVGIQSTHSSVLTASFTLKDYPMIFQMVPAASSANIQWALYSTANGVPTGAPLYNSLNHTLANARDVIEETGLTLTLQPGVYAVAVVSDTGATIRGLTDAALPGITGQVTSKAVGGKSSFAATLNSGTPASTWPSSPAITYIASTAAFSGAVEPMVWLRE